MRYLIISSDTYPPFRVDVSVLFGEEMIRLGHNIDWILQSENECKEDYIIDWKGSRVYVGSTDLKESRLNRIKKHFLGLRHDLKVFKLAAKNNYDFIQVKDKFLISFFAILAAKKNHCKFIFWLSYPFPEASLYEARVGTARYPFLYKIRGYFFKFILYRIIAKYADHVFVQSEQMKKDVLKEGMKEDKVTPVPMGISLDMLKESPGLQQANMKKGDHNIVYLGTLLGTRKLDFLIRVFALVLERLPDAILYMVGPEELPGDLKILQKEALRLGVLEKVVFTGRLPREEAFSYIRQADVCVSPFYPTQILNSTSPTKLIEYMALKKPVVANDHPDQSLVISESGGGICVPYQEDAFAAAIVKILLDPGMAELMAKKGYQYVTECRTYTYLSELIDGKYKEIRAS